ncbi:MAG: recombinase family protein [Brevundimonas sp.]
MDGKPRTRCAIYTRKSSEEGLSQAFNSLHAQREYCEAYIRSQGGEGWMADRRRYDDGGFSGASMARPGLLRLLADIEARLVDAVVVYKVDRLTRSLADFARILEALDKRGVAFVSVTQAFNTNSSMGRLTLNVLLSFAQFERDVTGERIRDKIAASKAKGMWMGGVVPLGYDAPDSSGDRRLRVNEAEAATVRMIFDRLIVCRSLHELQQQLAEEGVRSKAGRSRRGRVYPAMRFSSGALRHLLRNKTYLGLICHKGGTYEGRHEAIVDQQTFDAVQALLSKRSAMWKARAPSLERAPLRGRVFDELGQPMRPAFVRLKRKSYSYYVGPRPVLGLVGPERSDVLRRVPCAPLEAVVCRRLAHLLDRDERVIGIEELRRAVARVEIRSDCAHLVLALRTLRDLNPVLDSVSAVEARLGSGDRVLVEGVRQGHVRIVMSIRMKFRGGRTWIGDQDQELGASARAAKSGALKRLRRAHEIFAPARPGLSTLRRVTRTAKAPPADYRKFSWVFLAPDIQSAILTGQLPAAAVAKLTHHQSIPLSWTVQRRLLGTICVKERDVVSAPTSPQIRLH